MSDDTQDHATSRLAWNRIAEFWNQRMGEGNDFVDVLIWPCVERLIAPVDGRRVLDIACVVPSSIGSSMCPIRHNWQR